MMQITQAKRPKNSQLSKDKLLAQGITVPEWEDALKRYLKAEGKMVWKIMSFDKGKEELKNEE